MLKSLYLENYRGFERHEIPFKELTVIVGKNNAGKSTIVEALRLISIVTARYKGLTYSTCPRWLVSPTATHGVKPSLKGIGVDFQTVFHRYGTPPAKLVAQFTDGSMIEINIESDDKVFAAIYDSDGVIIKSKSYADTVKLPTVSIMPQVSPVRASENVLNVDYVRRASSSPMSSSHFRNQLQIHSEDFADFQSLVEETWPGVRVDELIERRNLPNRELFLEVRNEDFVGEIGVMGHGLQMWLQTMWFLVRARNSDTVILDEPDVYMHADLQRKIIRLLKQKFGQVLITTHSVEIMAEVEPEEILVVDKKKEKSNFTTSLPLVQSLVEKIGSVHNLHLTRLWDAKRFLIVEGKDVKILKEVQNIMFPDSETPLDVIPNMDIGGWGGWNYAVGSSKTLKNAVGSKILTYCIFDRDYHAEEEVAQRHADAAGKGVQLHIWKKKEIESYFITPAVIQRLIDTRAKKSTIIPSAEAVEEKIRCLSEDMEDNLLDLLATEIQSNNRSLTVASANREARIALMAKREQVGLPSAVSGKDLLSKISDWSKSEFGVSLSFISIVREHRANEIDKEMKSVISAIERGTGFSR